MSSFNPYEQNLTIIANNRPPFNVSIADIDEYAQEGITTCIDYGTQLGASVVTFLMLLLLTRAKKRRSAVFCLNMAALFINTARLICDMLYYTGNFFETYAYFSGDYTRVTASDYANSILAMASDALLQICIECSLVLQTMVICVNLPRLQKRLFLCLSVTLVLVSVGFRIAQTALNAIFTMKLRNFYVYTWLQKANTILLTINICFFSAVFVCKLAYSIYRRRQLGLRQFGPMQALFIMSCQTMLVPAIFAILQFTTDVPEINSSIFTFVVISLPVTSIWASSALPGQLKSRTDSESGQPLWNMLSSTTTSRSDEPAFGSPQLSTAPIITGAAAHSDLLYRDLEAGKHTFGIRRDFAKHS